MSAYCTTKFEVRRFTESLRAEVLTEDCPVRVTAAQRGRAEPYNEKLLKMSPARAAEITSDFQLTKPRKHVCMPVRRFGCAAVARR
ncbi:hypothetical protein AU198_13415 [Mycobacterium sp. GA-1199]|nr:hypothetical protein AU198_13415 [Mycobacterium sp. GA-1199]